MKRYTLILGALLLAATLAACGTTSSASTGPATVMTKQDSQLGTILADSNGMTLYRFTKDQANVSNCYDTCAQNWPPLLLSSGNPVAPSGFNGQLGTITRKDGSKQVTYNGLPLYYFVKDKASTDVTGQNVGNIWFVVKPGEKPASKGGSGGGY